MMVTEMKWPGWPELPFLLLFVGVVLLVALALLEAPGPGADGESSGATQEIVPEGSKGR